MLLALQQGRDAEAALDAALAAGAPREDVLLPLLRAQLQQAEHGRLLATSDPSPYSDPERQAEYLALRGIAWLRTGDAAAARLAFEQALALIPRQIDALLGQAEDALGRGDSQGARALLVDATRAHPGSAAAWEQLADLDYRMGRYREADASLAAAEVAARNPWIPGLKRVIVKARLGRFEAAEAELERIEAAWPKFPALHLARGILQLEQGQLLVGIGSLQEYLRYDPTNRLALQRLAEAAVELGDRDAAEELLRRDLHVRPTEPASNRRLSELLLQRGDADGAAQLLLPFAESGHADPTLLALLAKALALAGRPAAALRWIGAAIDAAPDQPAYRVDAADLLMQQGKPRAALVQLDRVLLLDPRQRAAQLLKTKILLVLGEPKAAVAAASALSTQQPHDAAALNALGLAQLAAGKPESAALAFEQALASDPGFIDAAANLVNLRVREGDFAAARVILRPLLDSASTRVEALQMQAALDAREHGSRAVIERLEPAVEAHPMALELRLTLAQALLDAGRPGDARRLLQTSPAELLASADLQALLAESLRQLGDLNLAVEAYRAALQSAPDSAGIRYRLASAMAAMGDADAMEEALAEAVALNAEHRLFEPTLRQVLARLPLTMARAALLERLAQGSRNHPVLLEAQADFQVRSGDAQAALTSYEALQEQAPDNTRLLRKRILLHHRRGALEAAETLLRQWLALEAESTVARLMLAETLQARGDDAAARAALEALAQDQPDNAAALGNLARLLREADPDAALAYAERASRLAPTDIEIRQILGALLLDHGDSTRALLLWENAYRSAPMDPGIARNYAQVLRQAGRSAEASKVLRETGLDADVIPADGGRSQD